MGHSYNGLVFMFLSDFFLWYCHILRVHAIPTYSQYNDLIHKPAALPPQYSLQEVMIPANCIQ